MKSLLQAISDLHSAELYDDVIFCVALRLQEHLLDAELIESEQALLFKLIGDAYYQTDCFYQSIKYYERALGIVRPFPRNSYSKTINQSELRYLIHKALLREKNYEEAIKVLSAIPKNEHTPKSRAALAKLLTTKLSKQSKPEIIASHTFVLSNYPNAFYTQNELLKLGHTAAKRIIKDSTDDDPATVVFFKARVLIGELRPLEAISILQSYSRPNAKITLELANLFNFVGNRSRAIEKLERLRLTDPYCVKGMDLLAGLYYANQITTNSSTELESLVQDLNRYHPNAPETYVALAYLSKQQNRNKEALLFAQRALVISQPGKDKAHAALLRALILIENKNYETADQFLQNILSIDCQNIDAWELSIRANLQRKAFEAAKQMGQSCRKNIGIDNPRAVFLYAQAIFNQTSMKDECENCLKELVEKAPYLTDAVVLLAKICDQQQKYKIAIPMLKKAANSNLNPIIQTILEDLNAKCKKTVDLLSTYRHSISSQNPDPFVLHSLNEAPVSFAATPDCGSIPGIARGIGAPRRQRSNAIRQPGGLDLLQRLEFTDSIDLETSQELFTNAAGYSFQTPTAAYIDDLDEDVIDVGTNGASRR